MNLNPQATAILLSAAQKLKAGFEHLPEIPNSFDPLSCESILTLVAEKLQDNYPYQHPFYLGQMMKPPHPVAQLAYSLAMSINPNNHALDGGRASSQMEQECIQHMASMVGWKNALGHLCGGGTIANLEALWVAREQTAGKAIAVSQQAHYTHARCASVLGVPCLLITHDAQGRMDITALQRALDVEEIGTVVVTLGTTGLGAIDPLDQVLKLQRKYGFRIHVDSAYGGYFKLAGNLANHAREQFARLAQVDSIVIDPHKHGLQPYGCGCVLFKDSLAAKVYKHHSPYTYFTSDQLHLGEISLECSRAGASAVALWATLQLFPLQPEGDFARNLESSRDAARMLYDWLQSTSTYCPVVDPELDIVVWSVCAPSASRSSELARSLFEKFAQHDLHLALITLPRELVEENQSIANWDAPEVTCLRACVMKPEHKAWMPRILQRLQEITHSN